MSPSLAENVDHQEDGMITYGKKHTSPDLRVPGKDPLQQEGETGTCSSEFQSRINTDDLKGFMKCKYKLTSVNLYSGTCIFNVCKKFDLTMFCI